MDCDTIKASPAPSSSCLSRKAPQVCPKGLAYRVCFLFALHFQFFLAGSAYGILTQGTYDLYNKFQERQAGGVYFSRNSLILRWGWNHIIQLDTMPARRPKQTGLLMVSSFEKTIKEGAMDQLAAQREQYTGNQGDLHVAF